MEYPKVPDVIKGPEPTPWPSFDEYILGGMDAIAQTLAPRFVLDEGRLADLRKLLPLARECIIPEAVQLDVDEETGRLTIRLTVTDLVLRHSKGHPLLTLLQMPDSFALTRIRDRHLLYLDLHLDGFWKAAN